MMNLNGPSGCWVELEQWCKRWRLQSIDTQVLLTKKFLSCNECICQLLPMNQDILIRHKQLQTLDPDWIFTFSGVGALSSTTIGKGGVESTAGGGELGGGELDGDLGGGGSDMSWLGHACMQELGAALHCF